MRKALSAPILLLLFGCLIGPHQPALAQSPDATKKDYVAWGQNFLRAMYPALNGKNHALTVETSLAYDNANQPYSWLALSVGEGFKYWVKEYRGCANTIPVTSPPKPDESPSPLPVPEPLPADKQLTVELSKPNNPCKMGPVYPTQFLMASFNFDHKGTLTAFSATGPSINDNRSDTAVSEVIRSHPELSDNDIISLLKQAGAKYGPTEKEQFVSDLPLKELEPFVGKLQLLSVDFHPLSEYRVLLPVWPDWTVEALATQADGSKLRYKMTFDHLSGKLTALFLLAEKPPGHP